MKHGLANRQVRTARTETRQGRKMSVEEVSGRTVEDAVERALAKLEVARDHVDVEVIREGKKGLLGFGGEDAIVRVTSKDDAAASGANGERNRGRRGQGGGRTRSNDSSAENRNDNRGTRRGGSGGQERSRRSREDEHNRDEQAYQERERIPFTGELPPVPGAPEDLPTAPPADAEDEIDFAGRTLRDLLNILGLVDTHIDGRNPETPGDGKGRTAQVFDISGETENASDELGLLIGRRGETLGALQYLINVTVRQRYGEADYVFAVDVEGYRRRREQSLVDMAQRVAAEVRTSGDVITLEPMRAAERRIIHMALSNEPGVETESVGSGNQRQVEVLPSQIVEADEDNNEDNNEDTYDEGPDR
jgi:spoIIIJ-associated protein